VDPDQAKVFCEKNEKCLSFTTDTSKNVTTFYSTLMILYDMKKNGKGASAPYTTYVRSAQTGDQGVECLLMAEGEALVNVGKSLPYDDNFSTDGWAIVLDGRDHVERIMTSINKGHVHSGVPVMLGTNLDEATEFMELLPRLHCNATLPELLAFSYESFGPKTPLDVRSLYQTLRQPLPECSDRPFSFEEDNEDAEQHKLNSSQWWDVGMRAATDYGLTCPVRRLARTVTSVNNKTEDDNATKVFRYYFTRTPIYSANFKTTKTMGAFHGAEVPFVFGDGFELNGEEEITLSRRMGCYWSNFAATGDPNNGTCANISLPSWPEFRQDQSEKTLVLDVGSKLEVAENLSNERCDMFDKKGVYPA